MMVNVCRLLVATTFVFSGYVKVNDPLGTQYKIADYLTAVGMVEVPDYVTMIAAAVLGIVELTLGVCVLFAIQRRAVGRATLAFMAVMTVVSAWLALTDAVADCGCFGDAVVLTNQQTLYKNLLLTAATVALVWRPMAMPRFISSSNQSIVVTYTIIFALATAGQSLYTLPKFDFRPYYVGSRLHPSAADGANGAAAASVNPAVDLCIERMGTYEEMTDSVLGHRGYVFLLAAPQLDKANDGNFSEINEVYDYCRAQGYPFYALTASNEKSIARWQDTTGAEYEFFFADDTVLKTMIRSNPGLLLLKDGVVIGKWSNNNMPELEMDSPPLPATSYGQLNSTATSRKLMGVLLWYILPLLLITLIDRTWHFTVWLRKRRRKNRIKLYELINGKKNMRKKIVAGNWKMNLNLQEGVALAKELNEKLTAEKPNCDVVICTPFIHLASVSTAIDHSVVGLGAENCADKESGAYTGEVSAAMVKSTGAEYVILGHSERRGYYGETPEILKEKVLLALKNGLKVIFCIGESLEEREANKQNEVVKAELEGSVFNLSAEEFANIVIAYEPIWAIGTGKTATSDQAEEIHAYIRSIIANKYGDAVADSTSILYGGSCKASNAPELFAKPDIDGGLIGGASLKAADFIGIIDAWK